MAKRTCTVVEDGARCTEAVHGRGYCGLHYHRWMRHGDPLYRSRATNDPNSLPALHGWMNRTFPRTGRCEYCGRRGKTDYASIEHRYTRWRHDWFELCRRCHCAFDYASRRNNGAYNRVKTHCIRGHKFTPENTYVDKHGWRYCRACGAAKARRERVLKRDRKQQTRGGKSALGPIGANRIDGEPLAEPR